MASNNPDHEKNLTPWKPGQSGNPNGRPKKLFRHINEKLQDEGYEPLKRDQLIEAYQILFNCDDAKLFQLANDPDTPYLMKAIIGELASVENRFEALKDFRNYVFGKPKDVVEFQEQPLWTLKFDKEKFKDEIKTKFTTGEDHRPPNRSTETDWD